MLLAFDTATPAVTVALAGSDQVWESTAVDARRHGELLAPAVADVLRQADATPEDLTEVAVGVGPGPFTGLRVGLVTGRTLGFVLGVPVRGVCTLDVIAAAVADDAVGEEGFAVATDARRREVYWARYDGSRRRLDGPRVARPADVAGGQPVAGAGAELYPECFGHGVEPMYPDARVLARLVAERPEVVCDPEPLYLRRPDTAAPKPPKPVLDPRRHGTGGG